MKREKDMNPAYGIMGFSRVSGGDPDLFGSSVKHGQKIVMTLKHGGVERNLNRDWYFGKDTIAEGEMSYTQFAELISSMNVGPGVPVTIRYTEKDGKTEPVNRVSVRELHLQEFEEANNEKSELINELIGKLKDIFSEKRSLKAKEREDVLNALNKLYMEVNSNNTFMLKQFNEAMEKVSTEAKGEVEAFVENKMRSVALAAMNEKGILNEIPVVEVDDET